MKKYNILIFPGGTEIGLEISKCLCNCKNIDLFSVGEKSSSHAPFVFFKHLIIPSIYESNWINLLNRVIKDNKIDYIFPAHDDVIVALSTNEDKIKTKIISSPLKTCLITRSKSKTYQLFQDLIPVPIIYQKNDDIIHYPIFAKPDKGQGSQDTHIVNNQQKYDELLKINNKEYIFSEYLSGDEYTIDCFSDREKGLLFCDPRKRVRTRNGISMNSHSVEYDLEIFTSYAQIINSTLEFYGAWFFQVKKNHNGVYTLLEIAPRIAGTMALQRVKGINLPLLSLYENQRIPITIMFNEIQIEIDRALVNHYKHNVKYKRVYVDLDDTLIINQKINTILVRFLYQCINTSIPITLITKHKGNLQKTLEKYRLSLLFDEVIHISMSHNKWEYITEENSIFIDDSFTERQSVHQNKGILTFDSSMIEMLLDERC